MLAAVLAVTLPLTSPDEVLQSLSMISVLQWKGGARIFPWPIKSSVKYELLEVSRCPHTTPWRHRPEDARIVESALTHFGRLDAVISNAGIYEMMPFDEIPVDSWRRMINVHLDGSFYLSQPAYKVMKGQGYGRFVFISSSGGAFGIPFAAHYAAAKAGIIGLANNVALEGAPFGILANTVLPFGQTRMAAVGGEPEEGSLLALNASELVAPIVVFLASRDCSVSHQNYSACAGRYARVFVGAADGWYSQREPTPTADDVSAHLDEVTAVEPFTVPGSIVEEMEAVAQRLGVTI